MIDDGAANRPQRARRRHEMGKQAGSRVNRGDHPALPRQRAGHIVG